MNLTRTCGQEPTYHLLQGRGIPPEYLSPDGDRFELKDPGDPWRHADGCLGLKDPAGEFDARLDAGTYDITAEALALREPFPLRGVRAGFENPNGEYTPRSGSVLRFARAGLRVGRVASMMVNGVDDRMSLPVIEHLALYRDPLQTPDSAIGDGAATWTDLPSDQLTIQNVAVSCCTYGLLNTSYIDAMRVRALHTGRVTFPLYFASADEAGHFTAGWYGTVSDCCFADGDGPVVIEGASHPWQFSGVLIVRQGRRQTHKPACNILWGVDFGRCSGGAIDSPGQLRGLFDGVATREASRIAADGMILSGNGNFISTFFRDANGEGQANLRLTRGSSRNIIQSQFGGTLNGAVDLIIERGCEDNVICVAPGMTIVDQGTNTRYIGAEWANKIE